MEEEPGMYECEKCGVYYDTSEEVEDCPCKKCDNGKQNNICGWK